MNGEALLVVGGVITVFGGIFFVPLYFFIRWKRQTAIRNVFTKFVRPELAEALDKTGTILPLNEFRTEKVNYVLIAVHGATPQEIGKHLGIVADVAKECGWYADCLFSNLAVLIDNPGLPGNGTPLKRSELVARIGASLGKQCKSIGGEEIVPCGDYGSVNRRVFGAQLPTFLTLVSKLEKLALGEHV